MRSFHQTAAALAQYDAFIDSLAKDVWPTNYVTGLKQEQMLDRLVRSVGTAFYEDTKDINHLQDCLQLTIGTPNVPPGGRLSFIRRSVKEWKEKQ